MFRTIFATALIAPALIATATPALANRLAHSPQQVSDALKEGCTVQHVHTPSGKTVQSPALVRCDNRAEIAAKKTAPAAKTVLAAAN